ncbi:scavenger receptor class F member 2-like isoform X2 [Mizuhopecten yessoensis]|uniref:scavenger receptor class F member 2-like isoform X2 n=1 Tax=Mizuhopecten yessoensis TaxID=6573 RepID=UPI000B45CF48|nr:scavenger receptor class F member 2-like isoform X2 [Mizuhopecten yessoensis]
MEVCPMWLVILFFIASVQIVNTSVNTSLGPKVTTSQSSNYDNTYISDKVVDNCINQTLRSGCCSHTKGNPTPNEVWWLIDLGDQVVIEYVKIYYRDEGSLEQKGRFAGHQIYLSDTTTGWRKSGSCFTDTTSTQNMVKLTQQITSCTGNTRYLTIYVDRRTKSYDWYSTQAILELCEVQVYGCPLGKYGNSNCGSNCDTTCVNSLCHPNSGRCTYCAPGFYKSGLVCTACPTNCLNGVCNVESGVCSDCDNSFFGPFCAACSPNCADPVCDKTSGNCDQCVVGFHGNMCNQTCPANCKNNTCSQDNGFCTTGCDSGYHGNMCQHTCPTNCKDRMCMQDTGICEGCEDRFFGPLCVACSPNCVDPVCDKLSGKCSLVSLPCKEDDFNAAAVGIGSGCGVVIVVMALVIIVQARRHRSMIHQNTTRSTTMTDISLPRIGQERRTETDGTYAVIGAQETEESITKMSARDSSYEQLGYRERDVPHLYETT